MAIYLKDKLAKAFRGRYKPVNIYQGNKKLAGWEYSTKTGESVIFGNTYDDALTQLVIYGNTTFEGGVGDGSGNVYEFAISSYTDGETEYRNVILPHQLNKVGTVADEYDVIAGGGTKKISSVVILDGNRPWVPTGNATGYKRAQFATSLLSEPPDTAFPIKALAYKYNGSIISPVNGAGQETGGDNIRFSGGATNVIVTVSDADSGFSAGMTPTTPEWKAYFYGWKMCNADGSTPYSGTGTKYWKHITDGGGLTSTLPTASYAGYTPYRMVYQLATPIPITGTPVAVPTRYPSTEIGTLSEAAPSSITATARVMI